MNQRATRERKRRSGGQTGSNGGFRKDDSGKPPLSMLPRRPLEEVALAFAHGARKYGRDNYRKGADWTRYADATLRHVYAFIEREDTDVDSGRSHLAHAAASLLMLLDHQLRSYGTDDRPQVGRY